MLAEKVGQVVRFVECRYQEINSNEIIRGGLPGIKDLTVRPMSLKAIFLTLARTYRLHD